MLTTYDLTSVEQFAANFAARLDGCEVGFCEDLDKSLRCAFDLCGEIRGECARWAGEVYSGRQPADPRVEAVFKAKLWQALAHAGSLAEFGEEQRHDCVELKWLDRLHRRVRELTGLHDNWVSPARSTGPGPRVAVGDAAAAEIRESLSALPPLPADWSPRRHQLPAVLRPGPK